MGNPPTHGPPGWWRASDGLWYPPEMHPDRRPPTERRPSQFRTGMNLGAGIGCGLLVALALLWFVVAVIGELATR